MVTDPRPNASNLVFGLCLVFVGAAFALDGMHIVDASRVLRFWPIGLVLFGLSLVVQTFRPGNSETVGPGEVRNPLHGWHILGIVLVGVLVTQTLRGRESARADPGETVRLLAVMSEDKRTSDATRFRGGQMTSVMGGCTLDLRQATLGPGEEATIDVFALMGGLVLRVPDGWSVDVRALPIMGGVTDQRFGADGRLKGRRRLSDGDVEVNEPAPAPPAGVDQTARANGPAPRIVLRGFIMMGGLAIKS